MGRFLNRLLVGCLLLSIAVAFVGCTAAQKSRSLARRSTEDNVRTPAKTAEAEALGRLDRSSSDDAESLEQPSVETSPIIQSSATQESAAVTATVAETTDQAKSDGPAENLESLSTDTASTLSLQGILYLADAQNPNISLARERINESYARVQRAQVLWLPSLRAGLNYNYHDGAIQSVAGDVFQTTRSAFGGGFGAGMYGAASPAIPGLIAQFHLSDAIFQPKIASHQAASRQFGAAAARNDVLRDAVVAYLELGRAEHGKAIAEEALRNTERLAGLTHHYAQTGQGLQSDDERMETELALRREQLTAQEEAVVVASARLAQILHADPAMSIRTGEDYIVPLEVLAIEDSATGYVVQGLSRRPELAEQKHLVCEAVERLNREKYAPLIPSVLLGMSYGGMGGGLGTSIINSNSRFDADAMAYWELRNMGAGDRAAQGETASVARQAQMRQVALLDRVAREVVEAHTQVIQRKKRLAQAEKGIASALKSYDLNLQRIENAQGLPIEVLQAIQALANARRSYLNAVVDYNIAQFELSRATGWFVE